MPSIFLVNLPFTEGYRLWAPLVFNQSPYSFWCFKQGLLRVPDARCQPVSEGALTIRVDARLRVIEVFKLTRSPSVTEKWFSSPSGHTGYVKSFVFASGNPLNEWISILSLSMGKSPWTGLSELTAQPTTVCAVARLGGINTTRPYMHECGI